MNFIDIYRKTRKKFRPIKMAYRNFLASCETIRLLHFMAKSAGEKRIFYLGRTENNNLGDNGQYYCILKWISKNFPEYKLHLTAAYYITTTWKIWLNVFVRYFNYNSDIIIFQSGYNTHDFGSSHPLMHELICENLKDARIIMMPQTVYFQNEVNKNRTARNHDAAQNMLFLARDAVSYETAKEMFPHIKVLLFPDIVTTLIGKYDFKKRREKIFLCCRDDDEKFYSYEEIDNLKNKLSTISSVEFGDTQSHLSGRNLRRNLKKNIEEEIERLSQYRVIITDRYHGTIYALCANTPVIIIKTKDHKVTTGADWFKGIYDHHVFIAKDLNDAFIKAQEICANFEYVQLKPFFEENYYSHLKEYYDNVVSNSTKS